MIIVETKNHKSEAPLSNIQHKRAFCNSSSNLQWNRWLEMLSATIWNASLLKELATAFPSCITMHPEQICKWWQQEHRFKGHPHGEFNPQIEEYSIHFLGQLQSLNKWNYCEKGHQFVYPATFGKHHQVLISWWIHRVFAWQVIFGKSADVFTLHLMAQPSACQVPNRIAMTPAKKSCLSQTFLGMSGHPSENVTWWHAGQEACLAKTFCEQASSQTNTKRTPKHRIQHETSSRARGNDLDDCLEDSLKDSCLRSKLFQISLQKNKRNERCEVVELM